MENETPQIETRYRRIYRTYTAEDGKKSWDLFVRRDNDKSTISTIVSEKIAEGEEKTLSAFLRESKSDVTLEIWSGFVGDTLKKYERQFISNVDYDIGTLFMSEIYDNALHIYNRTNSVAKVSEKIVEFAMMQMKKKQKLL